MSIVVPGLTHCEEHMNLIGLGHVCEECEEKRKTLEIKRIYKNLNEEKKYVSN